MASKKAQNRLVARTDSKHYDFSCPTSVSLLPPRIANRPHSLRIYDHRNLVCHLVSDTIMREGLFL
jgi:hypothetical protein